MRIFGHVNQHSLLDGVRRRIPHGSSRRLNPNNLEERDGARMFLIMSTAFPSRSLYLRIPSRTRRKRQDYSKMDASRKRVSSVFILEECFRIMEGRPRCLGGDLEMSDHLKDFGDFRIPGSKLCEFLQVGFRPDWIFQIIIIENA